LKIDPTDLAPFIEHTLLQPDATTRDLEQLCDEARAHKFFAVCVHGSRVELARALLEESPVKIVCVVGSHPH
jgi:deoxyribose-phosphate aldolase